MPPTMLTRPCGCLLRLGFNQLIHCLAGLVGLADKSTCDSRLLPFKGATIADVAREAGVSKATVSRFLNHLEKLLPSESPHG